MINHYAAADTYVFWDIVDFKVDEDEDEIDSFHTDLELTLLKEGYNGVMIITAYGACRTFFCVGVGVFTSPHPVETTK